MADPAREFGHARLSLSMLELNRLTSAERRAAVRRAARRRAAAAWQAARRAPSRQPSERPHRPLSSPRQPSRRRPHCPAPSSASRWPYSPLSAGRPASPGACRACGTPRAAGTRKPATRTRVRTESRWRCPARRWPAPGLTDRRTRPPRSAGGWATSGRCTGARAARGRTSRALGRTDRRGGQSSRGGCYRPARRVRSASTNAALLARQLATGAVTRSSYGCGPPAAGRSDTTSSPSISPVPGCR